MAALAGSLGRIVPAQSEGAGADELLSRFLVWVKDRGLELYPAQEEAILELFDGKHVILGTPTGSGKSLVALALHYKAMSEGQVSYYTAPVKALVNEKFFALCDAFGAESVGMMTGDASINAKAPILCCTAEVLANQALRDGASGIAYVVMDEFHYYGDKERGVAWQLPLLAMPHTTFLLMSATLGDTTAIKERIEERTGRKLAEVSSGKRPVELEFTYVETPLHETIAKLVTQHRAPIYLVNFTQRAAAEEAQNLLSVDFLSKDEKATIKQALEGVAFDSPYGKEFQRFIRQGIGLHHAGLLPKYRLLVEKLAQSGLLKVVSGTDTLGVGVNIPIRTVLFSKLCKYDGEKDLILPVREFHQIAGRAGRKGFDDSGSVVAEAPAHVIENLKLAEKQASGKKVVMQKPPQKGYIHWDRNTFMKLITGKPEPLESRFAVTHGMILTALRADSRGYRRIVEAVRGSHEPDKRRRQHLVTAKQQFRTLISAGVIETKPRARGRGAEVFVSTELQDDFSLNHTLSLYLLDTVERLDRQADGYAFDLLTLVESILENPHVVLRAQLDKLKTERMAEMKAEGIEFAERIEKLDQMEGPKPNAEFIYTTFNAFSEKHPWIGQENIRPKSVARELLENYASFPDYVRALGLQRSEGVLLRYLSETYKTLVQNVPLIARTETVDDLELALRTVVRSIDSSLLDEWERMRRPDSEAALRVAHLLPTASGQLDERALKARVRAALHRVLVALATKQYAEVATMFTPGEVDASPSALEAALAPFYAEHKSLVTTPAARRPDQTVFNQEGDVLVARQRLIDPEGDEDWMLEVGIDPRAVVAADDGRPILTLRRIGL